MDVEYYPFNCADGKLYFKTADGRMIEVMQNIIDVECEEDIEEQENENV